MLNLFKLTAGWRMMRLFRDYARLIVFCAGLLLGVQVPNFVDQYAKRISAHFQEAKANFRGYQDTADTHFNGSVEALVRHYESSSDTVFQGDAKNIRQIYTRIRGFGDELSALNAPMIKKLYHVAFHSDPEVLEKTFSEYSSTVPLSLEAIVCGLALGLAASSVFELVLMALVRLLALAFKPAAAVRPR